MKSNQNLSRIDTIDTYGSLAAGSIHMHIVMEPQSKYGFIIISMVLFSTLVFFSSLCDSRSLASTSKKNLNQFEGYRKGHKGLLPIKTYLHRYGYLDSLNHLDHEFDDELESAILTYQQNFRLNTTGILDSETLAVMMAPRCGCPDIINGTNTMARRGHHATNSNSSSPFETSKYSFLLPHGKWDKGLLTVLINNDTFTPEEATWVEQGLVEWNKKTKFEFIVLGEPYTDEPDDDIRMEKFSGNHGDGYPFDGPGYALAHAWGPKDGRVHFDGDEHWTDGGMFDMTSIAVHELGHVLGLHHSKVKGSVMNPEIGFWEVKREPQKDDLDGIEALYPGFVRR